MKFVIEQSRDASLGNDGLDARKLGESACTRWDRSLSCFADLYSVVLDFSLTHIHRQLLLAILRLARRTLNFTFDNSFLRIMHCCLLALGLHRVLQTVVSVTRIEVGNWVSRIFYHWVAMDFVRFGLGSLCWIG